MEKKKRDKKKTATVKRSGAGAKSAAGSAARSPVAAGSVSTYLRSLPEDRRKIVSTLRKLILKNLPAGYRETMGWGMISYGIPLSTYPDTYNGQPLCYLALASQKTHIAIYAMGLYGDNEKERRFRNDFKKAGKKLDMGKSCIRFKTLDDLPLDVIEKLVSGTSVKGFIGLYERSRK